MVSNKKSAFVFLSALILGLSSQVQVTFAAPQYPPTIQTPVIGESIIAPIPPKIKNTAVVVPKATSDNIPVINENKAIPLSKSKIYSNANLVSPETPVLVANSLILGGVKNRNLNQVPTAIISSKKATELQVPSDVPTRISISSLPKSSSVQVRVVVGNKVIALGNLNSDSSGKITLPPLTLTEQGKTLSIQIVSGGKATSFSLRSTK